jgi:APA family basic amino acid/polyamine antiporter
MRVDSRWRVKSVGALVAGAAEERFALRRSLGALDVTLLGVGAIVGAGIFATMGTAAAGDAARPGAGPSLVLSFVITAAVCGLAALCYAELASMVPVSGSAYTYAYGTFGELVAWIIGWDLIIEYAVGNVAVAISWANYCHTLLRNLGADVPLWLATDYRTATRIPGLLAQAPHLFGVPIVCNVLALGIVAFITAVLVWGVRESALLNAAMVTIKLAVLLFFVVVGLRWVTLDEMVRNWQPFQPNGWSGTLAGAAVVFFAYIGFDAISTVAEETREPSRNLPIGIVASLAVCTVLYIAVAAVFTGLVPYPELTHRLATEQAEPLTLALEHVAPGARIASTIVALGSVIAHTAVLLVFQLGQSRIFFAMARDGLLPPAFARVHPRFRTPHVTTIVTGVAVGVVAAVATIDEMVDLTNVGTLFAFTVVCLGIPVLRRRDPDRPRAFRVPLGPWLVPLLGAASCVGLMAYLPPASWWRFTAWLALGLVLYAAYGIRHSALARRGQR